ncbi:class I SAM-dependent methyltransferase [Sphingomonas sp. M1-B02]|uniref:class I SAM-dependent methyltransferase n=1 Tax=Sphingomonas sp. M1-B02 TaxID=3114300 RepID=UPI00223EF1D8|nr:methyltransferase domain-containing protein [Sphingomonas sp. S6-11]UZK66245.1 class I SAM-dependent methyltransferase [Sphingomonas sp. S6-11]
MRKVLHVGCGQATIANMTPGFQDGSWEEIRFDINPDARPDIVGTITDMVAVESDSVDAVYSSHNLEHVYAHEVPRVLAEFRRVIKPEGFAVVTCPDLESVAAHIAAGKLADPLYQSPAGPISPLDILYGHGAAIARGETYMAHRTGFTRKTLQENAALAGFASLGVRHRPTYFDLWLVATKQPSAKDSIVDLMTRFCR